MIQADHQPDALLQWMGSLADPTRLRLLRVLERHELGVGDLCRVLQLPQSTVSRHLKLLGDEAWLTSRRQGTTNLYHMEREELLDSQRELWALIRRESEHWATFEQDAVRLARELRSHAAASRGFFEGAAAEWDATRREMYGDAFTHQALLALLPGEWTVADLGCGTGVVTVELAQRVRKVIAVDASDAMLSAARQRTGDRANVQLVRDELETLSLDAACCDAAVMLIVLSYLPDPAPALRHMRRILKPGGRAVVVDLMRHDRDDFRRQMNQQSLGFEHGELTRLLTDAGFSGVRCEPLPPEAEAKGPALLLATGVAA